VAKGADIHARDVAGAYPLLTAVETYSYYAPTIPPETFAAAKKVIQFLISKGSDVSSEDGRSLTPMRYVFSYARQTEEIFDILLSANPDLGVQGGQDGYALVHLLARRTWPKELDKILKNKEKYNFNVAAMDKKKMNVAHYSAGVKRQADGVLPVEYIMSYLPSYLRKSYANQSSTFGWTPVMLAARAKNLEAIQYLVENYGVNLNVVSIEGDTALKFAIEAGDEKVIQYLKDHGAKAAPELEPNKIYCDRSNPAPFTFEKLKLAMTEVCPEKLKKVEDVIAILPVTMKTNYTLLYHSRGIQKASFSHPRAILFGQDARFVVAFNGDPKLAGYDSLEGYQFNESKKTFEYFDINFSGSKPTISKMNPSACLMCHRESPRPNWDHWSLWPGVYRGDQEALYPKERKLFATYTKIKNKHARYKHLMQPSFSPVKTAFGNYSQGENINFEFDVLVKTLVAEKVANEMKTKPCLKPFRYALLGALSCREAMKNYFPAKLQEKMPHDYAKLLAEIQSSNVAELKDRRELQAAIFPGTPVGRYNREVGTAGGYGGSIDTDRIAGLRYVVEAVLGNGAMDGWFWRFDANANRYVETLVTPLEGLAWQGLVDPTGDKEIYDIYSANYSKIKSAGYVTAWIYNENGAAAKALCPMLVEKSLAALKDQSALACAQE
jgi:hypothetical protein